MWKLETIDTSKPLYLAVVEALEKDIRTGVLQPGEKLPTHRHLADVVGVTLSTATRIYQEAERRGLVSAVVGRGTFVTADAGRKSSVTDLALNSPRWDMGLARPLAKPDIALSTVARKILHKHSTLMTYCESQGLAEHRNAGADWLSRLGLRVLPKNVAITAGAQNALFIVCNSLFMPGDRIATDDLTYLGMKAVAHRNDIRLEGIPMDSEGMIPAELDSLCHRQQIKGVYLSGRIQNPTNTEMSLARKAALRDIIQRHNLLLIENDSCGYLDDSPGELLSSMLPRQSVYIAGLSKAFLAGLRIAYVAAPDRLIKPLTQGITDSMLSVSPICAEIAAEAIFAGHVDKIIPQKKVQIAKRVALFRKIFEGHDFNITDFSMFAWLFLPPPMKAADLECEAAKRDIRIFKSERFAVGFTPPPEAVRITLTGIENWADLKRALLTLERLVSRQL